MVRFLKKFRKSSKKSALAGDPQTHQTTDIDVDRNAEGDHRLRDISKTTVLMGLIGPSHQIPTAQGTQGSPNKAEGLGMNSFPRRKPQLRLQGTMIVAQVSRSAEVIAANVDPRYDRTARKRTRRRRLRRTTERAVWSQHS